MLGSAPGCAPPPAGLTNSTGSPDSRCCVTSRLPAVLGTCVHAGCPPCSSCCCPQREARSSQSSTRASCCIPSAHSRAMHPTQWATMVTQTAPWPATAGARHSRCHLGRPRNRSARMGAWRCRRRHPSDTCRAHRREAWFLTAQQRRWWRGTEGLWTHRTPCGSEVKITQEVWGSTDDRVRGHRTAVCRLRCRLPIRLRFARQQTRHADQPTPHAQPVR